MRFVRRIPAGFAVFSSRNHCLVRVVIRLHGFCHSIRIFCVDGFPQIGRALQRRCPLMRPIEFRFPFLPRFFDRTLHVLSEKQKRPRFPGASCVLLSTKKHERALTCYDRSGTIGRYSNSRLNRRHRWMRYLPFDEYHGRRRIPRFRSPLATCRSAGSPLDSIQRRR